MEDERLSAATAAPETAEFVTDPSTGLTGEEVEQRVRDGKINGEQTVRTKSVAQILRSNILTFFNFVFIGLAVILAFFVPDGMDGIGNFGFLILIVFNTAVGIFQELRAKRTMDKLSLLSAPKAVVLRDGKTEEIAIEKIVLDDITELSAGSQICADGVIVEGSCEVNESLITGEPDAILKTEGDEVMSGSFVVSGKAKCRVRHIGADNFVMKISSGAKYFKRPTSEIWRSLMLIVKVMSLVIVPVGIALFCIKYFAGGKADVNDTVITVIGSVIGMIPSGLVALASTVFCVSIIRLSKHKTVAQDLYCVETLARVDVLCLDKTGTITEGSMEVNGICPREGLSEEDFLAALKSVVSATGDDNATAQALKGYLSVSESNAEQARAEYVVPFSSARKWSGARINGKSYALGAVEFTLGHGEGEIYDKANEMSEKGFRVLALVSSDENFKGVSDKKADADSSESTEGTKTGLQGVALPDGVRFEGFVFITDKIRDDAPETLAFFRKQGVDVKVISGDNPATVRAVAMRAGLEGCDKIIDMSTLKTDEEVIDAATKYTIFGRVLPDQKLLLVKALKAAGHTVAMTGDGVNDVLALKEADCSVAMASGSDAAKNVSSLVLMNSNFSAMPKVVAEGRRSINNLERSASLYIMKTVYNVLLAILFMIVSQPLPFEPRNLTLIGGITIGMPSVVIALEPNNELVKGRFLTKVLSAAIPGGITVLLGSIAILIAQKHFLNITTEQVREMYIILTTFVGLVYLFRVCLPFTWLHGLTYIVMVGLFVACYLVDLPFFDLKAFFGINDKIVTWEMGKAMLSIGAVLTVIYATASIAMRNTHKKIDLALNKKLNKKVAV